MLELLYPVVLAALLLLISKIVRRIVAKVKTPVEYSSPSMWSGGEVSGRVVHNDGRSDGAVDIDRNNGGFGGGPGGGDSDPEVVLTPRNLLQQQSSVVDPPPVVSGVPRPPPRSRTSSNNSSSSVLDEINVISRTALEMARISNFALSVIKTVIQAVLAIAAAALSLRKMAQRPSKDDNVIRRNGRMCVPLPTISGCLETCELRAVTVC